MKQKKHILTLIVLILAFAKISFSQQCAQIVASPASASCNVSYNFNVTGDLFGTTFNFNSGTLPVGWVSTPYQVASPCSTKMIDNSSYFWATTLQGGVRYVVTNPLNVSQGGDIKFYMRYGSDDPSTGCEDPDLPQEGVYLQYSINGGKNWIQIATWTPVSGYVGPLYKWNKYTYTIPAAAKTTSTLFRWYQPSNSGDMFDNWGLDNVEVSAITSATTFAWNFGDGTSSNVQNPSHTFPAPGTYTVTLDVVSPNCITSTSTTVTVAPGPMLISSIIDPSCPNSTDGSISVNFQNATLPVTYNWTPSTIGNVNRATNLGEGAYDLFVRDNNGCIAASTFELKSKGSLKPIALTKDATISLDEFGNAGLTASTVDNGSYTNCGTIASIAIDKVSFDCSNVGSNDVTLTVTDNFGNQTSAIAKVSVIDAIAPVVATKDITVSLDATGVALISVADINNGSLDACGIASLVLDKTAFDCSNIGANTVTLTATDVNGNISSTTAIVTIVDAIAPVVLTKDLTINLDATGAASISASDINNGSSDACGIASLVVDKTAFDCSNVGENTVTLTATDVNGNISSATAIVKVVDATAPIAISKSITVQLDENGQAQIEARDVNNGSTDVCGIASISINKSTFTCSDVTPSIANLSIPSTVVRSFAGRTVTFNNININGTGTNFVTVAPGTNVTVSTKWNSSYNANYCPGCIQQFYIGVKDLAINCMYSGGSSYNISGNGSFSFIAPSKPGVYVVQAGSSLDYSCTATPASISDSKTDALAYIVVASQVNLTVTDVNGNVSNSKATVFVEDKIAPIVITKNIVVTLNASGTASITSSDINNGSSDACGIATLVLDKTSFDCSNVGVNTVTLTATDVNGNVTAATATVTVVDAIAPVVATKDITVNLDATGVASILVSDINNGSSDACGIATLVLDKTAFDCSNVGANTVTLTATDVNGNVSTATATVTVIDAIPAIVLTKDITVQLDATGAALISVADINNGSTDACGIASLVLDKTAFDCSNVGANTVTLTATDVNGNVSAATATVKVEDKIAPSITCPANVSVISKRDDCNPVVTWSAPIVTDNCSFTVASSQKSGDRFPVGTSVVTYTVTDASGNVSQCAFNVTVTPEPLISKIASVSLYAGNFNISCKGKNDGSATVSVIGGCLPYSYVWSNGQTNPTAVNLVAGSYTVTAKDANGTTTTVSVTLTEPTKLMSDISSPYVVSKYNTSCKVDGDGSISLVANGGVSPYKVIWSNGTQASFDLSGLKAGAYTATITDKNGCVATNAITLSKPENCNCLPTPPAPSVTCAVCQEIIDGKTNANLTTGKVSCVSRTFNGNINTQKSTLVICGDAIINSLNLSDGDKLIVLGKLTVQNFNINNVNVVCENYGTFIVTGSANLNGKITNNGTISFQSLNINNEGSLVNNGYATIKSNFGFNGAFVNNGQFKVEGDVTLNSNATFTNNCTLDLANITINSLKTCANNGTMTASKQLLMNSANFQLGQGSITSANSFTESQSNLVNAGANCNVFQVATTTLLNNGVFNGPIAFCDKNGIETNNNAKLINGATFSCSSCLYVSSTTKSNVEDAEVENEIEATASDLSFNVYPIPVGSEENLTIALGDEIKSVSIYNILGVKVYEKTVDEKSLSVSGKELGLGTFVIKVIGKDGKTFERMAIVK